MRKSWLGVLLTLGLWLTTGARAAPVDEVQGLLEHAHLSGAPSLAVGQPLTPPHALALWGALLQTPASPRTFAPRTVLAWLVREPLASGQPLPYAALLAHAARFRPLVVVRPDGYVTSALTGAPIARLGTPSLLAGELYVQRLRSGAFYFDSGGVYFAVDAGLGRHGLPLGERPLARDPATAALLGAEDALEQMARALAFLLVHPVRSLEGLRQLPASVASLLASSPDYFAHYGALNREDQVREAARLATHLLTLQGGTASLAPRLTQATRLPVLSVSAQGTLVVREVALPAGALTVTVGAGAASASLVLMAQAGAPPPGNASWPPPTSGPGTWVQKPETMSAEAERYQSQVTGAPPGWVYRVRTGPGPKDFVDFDGFRDGVLLEVKGPGYLDLLRKMHGKSWFEGLRNMIGQARRQTNAAMGHDVHWHFAEQEVARLMRVQIQKAEFDTIQVIHTPAAP